MISQRHEWDFDYTPHTRAERFRTVQAEPRREPTGWASPRVTKAIDAFWLTIWRTLGAVLAMALTAGLVVMLWAASFLFGSH